MAGFPGVTFSFGTNPLGSMGGVSPYSLNGMLPGITSPVNPFGFTPQTQYNPLDPFLGNIGGVRPPGFSGYPGIGAYPNPGISSPVQPPTYGRPPQDFFQQMFLMLFLLPLLQQLLGAQQPPRPNTNQQTLNVLEQNFDRIDTDGNGILDKQELESARTRLGNNAPALDRVINRLDELMFANIDPGNEAWYGLSRADVGALKNRVNNGETIDGAATDLRVQIARERGVSDTPEGFSQYVNQVRNGIRQNSVNQLNTGFDQYDKDQNGILTRDELLAAKETLGKSNPELSELVNRMDELMFANIDPGNAAWHGLSRQDLTAIAGKAGQSQNFGQIADELRAKIAQERGVNGSPEGFSAYIARMREIFRL